MSDTRNFIAGLITQINTATDPESVTNQMVARVMQYFLDELALAITTDRLANGAVTDAKIAANAVSIEQLTPALRRIITGLQTQINTLLNGDVSRAIETFNEVIAFLAGVTDEKTLTGLLNGLRTDIESLSDAVDDLENQEKIVFVDEFNDSDPAVPGEGRRYYNTDSKKLYRGQYNDDETPDLEWMEENLSSSVLYICKSDNVSYIWKNGNMQPVRTGDGTVSEEKLDSAVIQKLNAKEVAVCSFWGVWQPRRPMPIPTKAGMYMYFTDSQALQVSVVSQNVPTGYEFVTTEKKENVVYIDGTKNIPYIWNGTDMVAIAPEKAIFNATAEAPVNGFYTLIDQENTELSATHAAWNAGKAVLGLMISFKLSAKVVKTYQYIGATVTEQNWYNAENWQDFGSLATVVHHTETTASITPRDLHAWGGVQSLEISFVNGTPGCENEYKLEFTVSGNNFTLSLPADVRWIEEPEWQDGWTYQVSILNNLAIYAGWEAAQS